VRLEAVNAPPQITQIYEGTNQIQRRAILARLCAAMSAPSGMD
jgi:hypothetical protein